MEHVRFFLTETISIHFLRKIVLKRTKELYLPVIVLILSLFND